MTGTDTTHSNQYSFFVILVLPDPLSTMFVTPLCMGLSGMSGLTSNPANRQVA
jgi:hypothetical protein